MLDYCDYIANLIRTYILANDVDECKMLRSVSKWKYDLGEHGELLSSTKTLHVTDMNQKRYKITIEVE